TGVQSQARQLTTCRNERPRRMDPHFRRDDKMLQPPVVSVALRGTSSASEDDTDGTCSPSEAREIATRVLLKTLSTPPVSALRLLSSSDISTEWAPSESSATLPGVAEVRINALSGALIGARPCE